ncbi:MAG: hypothetical protein ACLQMT_07360 [Candidatus Acidiferrales bacterium]
MKHGFHRFLIHKLNHTTLLVDITEIGLPREIYPPEGKLQTVPSLRFRSWNHAEQYLLGLGASQKSLSAAVESLKKAGVAVLTITEALL